MNGRTPVPDPHASDRQRSRSVPVACPPAPDLFGFVPPASVSTATTPASRAAEWPAAGAAASSTRPARDVPIWPAPDRPLRPAPRAPSSLAGDYARRGVCLTRADRVTLWVRGTYRRQTGPTDAPRFVEVGHPGGGRPVYAGSLYDRGGRADDDLDGHAFQHGKRGRWYRIVATGPDAYRVEPAASRRGRKGL